VAPIKRGMPEQNRRALLRALVGVAAAVAVGIIVGDQLFMRLRTTRAATAWGIGVNVAWVPGFVWARMRPSNRSARLRRTIQTLGALAATLYVGAFSVVARTNRRYSNRIVTLPVRRFSSSVLVGFLAVMAYGLILRSRAPNSDPPRRRQGRATFLLTGWPNGDDRRTRSQWDCDDNFETIDAAVAAARSWLSTESDTAEVEIIEAQGDALNVVAVVTRNAVRPATLHDSSD
jgi:hypothetical protein